MKEQHFPINPTTQTTNVQSLARAFFLSLAVHAALFGVLWQFEVTRPPATTNMLRIELAPRANAIPATSALPSAEAPPGHVEPRLDRASRVVGATHAGRHTSASTTVEPRTAEPKAAPPAASNAAASADPAQNAAEAVAAPPAELAIDLRVLDWLAQHRAYPLAARRAHLEGVVQLRVTLMPDGRLVNAVVEHSSGHPLLDQAALELLTRASPLPAEFASGRTEQIELQLPIVYRMRVSST